GATSGPCAPRSASSQKRHTAIRSSVGMSRAVASIALTRRAKSSSDARVPASAAAAACSVSASAPRRPRSAADRPGCAILAPMPPPPRVHELPVPNLADFDFRALRAGRLARLQAMMKRHDLPVALLYTMANIRYATGVDVMAVWTAGTFARYCLVPAEGAPILFEYKGSIHVSQKVVHDVRPPHTWQYGGVAAPDKAREGARPTR